MMILALYLRLCWTEKNPLQWTSASKYFKNRGFQLESIEQGWGKSVVNRLADDSLVLPNERKGLDFLGTHAPSIIKLSFSENNHPRTLKGSCLYPRKFNYGNIICRITADDKILSQSPVLSKNLGKFSFDLNISEARELKLEIILPSNMQSINQAHGMWLIEDHG